MILQYFVVLIICDCIISLLSVTDLACSCFTVIMFVNCRSALMLACDSDSVETVEALLRGGAETQLVDALGHKAADYSVTTGNQQIIQMLQDGVLSGTV